MKKPLTKEEKYLKELEEYSIFDDDDDKDEDNLDYTDEFICEKCNHSTFYEGAIVESANFNPCCSRCGLKFG